MQKRITYHIWPNDIDFGEKLSIIHEFINNKGYEIKQNAQDPPNSFNIKQDKYNSYYTGFVQEFIELMDSIPFFETFWFTLHYIKEGNDFEFIVIIFRHFGSSIEISVQSHDNDLVELTHRFISDNVGLTNPVIPVDDEHRAFYPNPTVFVGRHFDQSSNDAYVKLNEFLTQLGFNVKQGEEYTSADIPKKVKVRIDRQDIFIALVKTDRNHDWIIAETSYAHGRGKHIILLVEEGSNFNPTILGTDLEQIRFPANCMEKNFIKLLKEFSSIHVKGIL